MTILEISYINDFVASTNDLDIARRAYFDTAQQPIALTEKRSGLVRAANAAFFALLGLPEEEVLGRNVVDLGLWGDVGQRNSFLSCLAIEGSLTRYPLLSTPRFQSSVLHVSAESVGPTEEELLLMRIDVVPALEDEPQAADHLYRDKQVQTLNSALSEKETLLREIHHRVKNNLQIVASLLYLQTDRTVDPIATRVLSEAADRVQSMALVHTMLYGSNTLSSIDAAEYLRTLALQIVRGASAEVHGVELRFKLEKLVLDTERAVPVGLIVNELVTNALKYGVGIPGPGVIELSLGLVGNQVEIVVSDSGGHLPLDFHPEDTQTLGMQLIMNLAGQLGGTMESSVGEATRFRIHFPL